MKYIEKNVETSHYRSRAWDLYTDECSICFIDIETTGLSLVHDSFFLGGQLCFSYSPLLRQYLIDSPKEEEELLRQYLNGLSDSDLWISYNGDRFDLPFLERRLKRYGICEDLPFHQSIDLYRWFQRYLPLAKILPNLKQTTLERALGFDALRTDELSGKESALLYQTYGKTKTTQIEQALLLHNSDDLLMLSRLLSAFNKLDLHRIFFEQGFLVKNQEQSLLIEHISLSKNVLTVCGKTSGMIQDQDVFLNEYQWTHQTSSSHFSLLVPCLSANNTTYIDLEKLPFDFTALSQYPGFYNGYLLLYDNGQFAFCEINHLIKILLKEIPMRF